MKTMLQTIGLAALLAAATATAQQSEENQPLVEVKTLQDGVWMHTSWQTMPDGNRFPSHGLVVREGDTLTLIDTAWGAEETSALLDALAVQVGLPVTRAVVTHFHGDRAGGVDVLEEEGVEVWAHPMTVELTTETERPVPDNAFEGLDEPGSAVEFSGLEVFYPGPAHTRDNIMVWLPGQDILFGGCAIRGADDKSLGNVRDGDIEHWATAMELTEDRYGEVGMVVSSHADPAGPELFGHTAYLARLAQQSKERSTQ